jgi:hypothetical protein
LTDTRPRDAEKPFETPLHLATQAIEGPQVVEGQKIIAAFGSGLDEGEKDLQEEFMKSADTYKAKSKPNIARGLCTVAARRKFNFAVSFH